MGTIKREPAIRAFSLMMVLTMLISIVPLAVSANTGKTDVPGKVYEFDKDSIMNLLTATDMLIPARAIHTVAFL